jgi:hypothetical protein
MTRGPAAPDGGHQPRRDHGLFAAAPPCSAKNGQNADAAAAPARAMNGGDGPQPARVAASYDARRARSYEATPLTVLLRACIGPRRKPVPDAFSSQPVAAYARRRRPSTAARHAAFGSALTARRRPRTRPSAWFLRARRVLQSMASPHALHPSVLRTPKQGGALRLHEPTPSGGARRPETDESIDSCTQQRGKTIGIREPYPFVHFQF